MYTRHEGMLFGDDFYDRYAQNVGGQFKDPYHNFLMTGARKIGPDADINRLYQQYQASGRTDTPDWATLDTTGPITTLPMLAHKWDASGGTPVERLSSAWNPTTPLIEGVTVPEGYWDAVLAYNMNMSKIHPDVIAQGNYDVQQVLDSNARANYAMSQGEYGNQGTLFNSYLSPSERAQQSKSIASSLANTRNHYNNMKANNNAYAASYGTSADEQNMEIDRLLEEAEARAAAEEAALQQRSAMYSKGGII
jgi:hypothetical protein